MSKKSMRKIHIPDDAEDKAIARGIDMDPDTQEWTEEQFAQARPAEKVNEFVRRRGPQKGPTKVPVSIRLDQDIVDYFKADGAGWQRRMNEALREAIPKR